MKSRPLLVRGHFSRLPTASPQSLSGARVGRREAARQRKAEGPSSPDSKHASAAGA